MLIIYCVILYLFVLFFYKYILDIHSKIYPRLSIMAIYSINLFHVLFVGPLLVAVGLYHDHPNFPQFMWQLLVILGIGVIGYQGWIAWTKYNAINSNSK